MLGPYWSARRRLIDEEYASIAPPADAFGPAVRHKLCSARDCTIDFFVSIPLLLSISFRPHEMFSKELFCRVWFQTMKAFLSRLRLTACMYLLLVEHGAV